MSDTCVIGWPIEHSRSPIIHNYWRTIHNISGTYDKVAVRPEDLAAFIQQLPRSKYIGCNVTIPHKESIIPLVNRVDADTLRLGAANTIYLRNGQTTATSTDGFGFVANLNHHAPNLNINGATIIVLGAGGSAKSIIGALIAGGAKAIWIVNRSLDKAEKLSAQFGNRINAMRANDAEPTFQSCDLLINATSLGMIGQPQQTISFDQLQRSAVVADIVYAPLVTSFLQDAERRGHLIVPGLGMLLHQAVGGFELWHGVKPRVTKELFALVEANLNQSTKP